MRSSAHRPGAAGRRTAIFLTAGIVIAGLAVGGYEIHAATSAKSPASSVLSQPSHAGAASGPAAAAVSTITGTVTAVHPSSISITLFKSTTAATIEIGPGTIAEKLTPGSVRSAVPGTYAAAMLGSTAGGVYSGAKQLVIGPAAVTLYAAQVPGSVAGAVTANNAGTVTIRESSGAVLAISTSRLLSASVMARATPGAAQVGDLIIVSAQQGTSTYQAKQLIILPSGGLGGEG